MSQYSDLDELHDAREHLDVGAFQRAVDAKLERSLVELQRRCLEPLAFGILVQKTSAHTNVPFRGP